MILKEEPLVGWGWKAKWAGPSYDPMERGSGCRACLRGTEFCMACSSEAADDCLAESMLDCFVHRIFDKILGHTTGRGISQCQLKMWK